jgi:hypothetical protein
MELTDLTRDERVALVGLTKILLTSDGKVSDEEVEHIEAIIEDVGDDSYTEALDTYEETFATDRERFRQFLTTITRQEARELIFGTVLEAAGAEAVGPAEAEPLDWLAKAWNVTVKVQED